MIAAYIAQPDTFHMTEDQQQATLLIAALVVALILLGVKSICDDVRASWSIDDANLSIDDLSDDLYAGRDQHAVVPMCAGSRWVA